MQVRHLPTALVLVLLVGMGKASAIEGQMVSETERRIVRAIDDEFEDAMQLLERIVNINSGTMNKEGVRAVGDVLRAELDDMGLRTRWIDFPEETNRAGHLFARTSGRGVGSSLLLIGHLDTFFESDDPSHRFRRDGTVASGPGASDMKGGDVVMMLALRGLASVGALHPADITVALTGDEENPGEPLAVVREHLMAAGARVDVALGFENGVRDDVVEYVTVARRSASEWRLEVTAKEGHSLEIFTQQAGAGAIFEASRILNDFYEEVRGEKNLTFNAGAILGGTDVAYDSQHTRGTVYGKTNLIPRRVVVHGGIRTISTEQLERARAAMHRVVRRHLPHTSAEITFIQGYPAMSPTTGNHELMGLYSATSEDLGFGKLFALDPARRGAADISFVAPFTDALAGLGPVGHGAHGPEDTVDLESIRIAAKRAAVMIYRLTQGPPPTM